MTIALCSPPEVRPAPLPHPTPPSLDRARPLPLARDARPDWWSQPDGDAALGFAHGVAGLLMETISGRRPLTQLVRWTSDQVLGELTLRRRLWGQDRRPLSVVSVRVQHPLPTVLEASVHFRQGSRSRALALRFERLAVAGRRQRWTLAVADFGG